jgi:hypothetical protein
MVSATDVDTSASLSPDDSEQPTISTAIKAETRIRYERTGMCISVNLAERVIVITRLLLNDKPTGDASAIYA